MTNRFNRPYLIRANLLALVITSAMGCQKHSAPFVPHTAWNIETNEPSGKPRSRRNGSTIVLSPSSTMIDLPTAWIEWYNKYKNTLHLSPTSIADVIQGSGEWDSRYSSVCNALLPANRCAAHIGGDGWGKDGVGTGDLQVRIYDLQQSVPFVKRDLRSRAVRELERLATQQNDLTFENTGRWSWCSIRYGVRDHDTIGVCRVDLWLTEINTGTIVFVFMCTENSRERSQIHAILASFRPRTKQTDRTDQ